MKRLLLPALAFLLIAASEPKNSVVQESEHVVQPGETLGGIAVRAQVPRILIAEANGLKPPYTLRAGQKLLIPRTRHHTVAAGETGFAIAMEYGISWPAIAVANGMKPDARVRTGQRLLIPTVIAPAPVTAPVASSTPATTAPPASPAASRRFAWPVRGPVRRGFTARPASSFHDGLDITASAGTAVRASAAGKIVFAGPEPRQFGNLVVIDHGSGWHSAYAFLSRITVKKGEEVGQGERIGLVGDTGLAKGNELHFELRRRGQPVDPAGQLPGN
jgi:murein DD-endopeptidase MepM/ murein hydrolase activator NlpD